MAERLSEDLDPSLVMDKIERLEKRLQRERAARKEAEAIAEQGMRDLYLANTELDSQVIERTAQLNRALENAAAAAQQRLNLLKALTREVRTPLNGITGMLELLKSSDVDNQSLQWIATAATSSDNLLQIFSRMSMYMEIAELDTVDLEPCAVEDLLSAAHAKWAQKCLAVGQLLVVENNCDTATTVNTNKQRFEQLIDEVLDNTVTHGQPGSVRIIANSDSFSESGVSISVIDSGPGITDSANHYETATEQAEAVGTLGLGYSIIRSLAALLEIDVTQTVEGSVEMTVSFGKAVNDGN